MKRFMMVSAVLSILLLTVGSAKGEDKMITKGSKVKFDYTLTTEGQVVDSSEGKQPLEYVHGDQMIIPGLEKNLEGLKVGDEKSITVSPEEGYGPIDPQGIIEFPKSNLDPSMEPQVGLFLQLSGPNGQVFPAVIQEVREETVLLNFNHPLAGKELTFQIKIVSIE